MAAAGQRDLDPRQVKAREEFERMREQLTQTLERNVDPTPWRERARERVAAFEREAARRRPTVPPVARSTRLPWMVALAAAFVLGVITAVAGAFLVLRPQPQATSDLAGIIIETPVETQTIAAAPPPAPRLAPASVREPERASVSASSADVRPEPAAEAPRIEDAVETASAEPVAAAFAQPEPVRPEPAIVEPEVAQPEAAEPAPAPVQAAPGSAAAPSTTASGDDNPVLRRVALIRESQSLLAALGYVPGRADGDAGPQTIAAAALFATERGLADSNFDPALLAALREARAGALPIRSTDDPEETVVQRVARIRETQALLLAQGFELGRADGDAGPATLEAAATFAENAGLADANIDAAFLAALREASVGGLQ